MFKCDQVENNHGIKKDELGATLVNLNRIGHKDYCFILASQPIQVFYIEDQLDPKWSVVIVNPRRYDSREDLGDIMLEHQNSSNLMPSIESFDKMSDDDLAYIQTYINEETLVENTDQKKSKLFYYIVDVLNRYFNVLVFI